MFYRLKEAGKSISADNMKKIQDIHDSAMSLGSSCGYGGISLAGGGLYEANRGNVTEAALPMTDSHDALRGHIRRALKVAHGQHPDSWHEDNPYVTDVFPQHVVYSHKGTSYKRKYDVKQGAAGSDPTVTLGDAKKVHVAYVDSKEQDKESMGIILAVSDDFTEDREKYASIGAQEGVTVTLEDGLTSVHEGVTITMVAKEGVVSALPKPIEVCIIKAGWGSMAYYPKDVIERDGPKVFKKGTFMMWNHATESQDMERPEGDLNDVAAIFTEDAKWKENGANGPGLYSKAKVFSDYANQVAEKGPYIGVSINAGIKCHEGDMEGRSGRIADKFVHAYSADFVTKAGAGGAPMVPVTESDRGTARKGESMLKTDAEIAVIEAENLRLKTENDALKASNTSMQTSQNHVLAVATVGAVLHESGIRVGQRVLERACKDPVMKEGKVDADWVKSVVMDFSEGYTGKVTGLGTTVVTEADAKKSEDKQKEIMRSLGVPEAGLAIAIQGRK